MRIKSMTATFGKLDKARLELGPGLNLIQAPNEGGKSTWCAFLKTMLYGLDTRDRDKKGYLADKNHYQPWSGAPMEGEITLEWQGRDITIRRGPKGSTPFGAFSAVDAATGQAVPGLTADTCGSLLTGVGREVFERSAFIGGGSLSVTSAPELERRIAALVSSGEEGVSHSQAQSRLKEWLNRRKVNRSVGLIPKLEGELEGICRDQAAQQELTAAIRRLEGEHAALLRLRQELTNEQHIHRRLAQKDVNRRYAQAGEELNAARAQLTALESEFAKYGPLPDQESLRRSQGELQYLKVLDEEIRQGEEALMQAEEAYVQAQIAAQDERFAGLTGEEAQVQVRDGLTQRENLLTAAAALAKRAKLGPVLGLLAMAAAGAFCLYRTDLTAVVAPIGGVLLATGLSLGWNWSRKAKDLRAQADKVLARFAAQTPEELTAHLEDYRVRCAAAEEAAAHSKAVRGNLNDRKARKENTHKDLMDFVHSFAPQATGLFGCSAAISRALSLDHELAAARDRVAERLRRREDLAAQGGQDFDTLEFLHTPERSAEETDRLLARTREQLERTQEQLNQALGRRKAMGDPAALAARREKLEEQLARRREEHGALTLSMEVLQQANGQLQERFSPALNRLAGDYLGQLTGQAYSSLTLNRELEGCAQRAGDILPHSALYLSRGTADQLYLAVRLAICQLCLEEKPPIVLDDALAAFDDARLTLALELLRELAGEQQVILFSCQTREQQALPAGDNVAHLAL